MHIEAARSHVEAKVGNRVAQHEMKRAVLGICCQVDDVKRMSLSCEPFS